MTTETKAQHELAKYQLLGRSGLRVSPLCLGAMNFGDKWDDFLGATSYETTELILDTYTSKGGNFIDTANKYHEGQSEERLGAWLNKRGNRDELVIASKYSLPMKKGVVNSAGNHRKNMFQAIDASLKRLGTHYIDLYYVHYWDFATHYDEIMRGLDDLVRLGKIHYVAISDAPAWEVARCNTLADLRGWSPFVAYQGRYHLGERDAEREIIPMAKSLDLAFVPWGILGGGKYTGKYKKGEKPQDVARSGVNISDHDYAMIEEVAKIAAETGRTPSQVCLNWALQNPGVNTFPLLGCRKIEQLHDNLGALEFKLSKEQLARLNAVTKFEVGFPANFIGTSYENNPWLKDAGLIVPKF